EMMKPKSKPLQLDPAAAACNFEKTLLHFERQVHGGGLILDFDFLRHDSGLAMRCFEGVFARRHVGNLKSAILAAHREVGMVKHTCVSKHPRMNVAREL